MSQRSKAIYRDGAFIQQVRPNLPGDTGGELMIHMDRAEKLLAHYSLSFWDAMIAAACLES
jgi:hypothetical protein